MKQPENNVEEILKTKKKYQFKIIFICLMFNVKSVKTKIMNFVIQYNYHFHGSAAIMWLPNCKKSNNRTLIIKFIIPKNS